MGRLRRWNQSRPVACGTVISGRRIPSALKDSGLSTLPELFTSASCPTPKRHPLPCRCSAVLCPKSRFGSGRISSGIPPERIIRIWPTPSQNPKADYWVQHSGDTTLKGKGRFSNEPAFVAENLAAHFRPRLRIPATPRDNSSADHVARQVNADVPLPRARNSGARAQAAP